jgi:hypothetical protein
LLRSEPSENWAADAGVISKAFAVCFPVEDDFFVVSSSSRIMDLESPRAALFPKIY